MRERLVIVSVAAGMVALIGCNDVNPAAQAPEQEAGTERLTSVVQLGDSIASGEGTLYGYQWDEASQTWTGGDVDAPWPPPYPDCHVSPDAYGNVVATYFGTQLHQFACTGATFAAGITTPEMDGNDEMRPAQFGDWDAKTDLNEEYDDAAPQLVLITLGADDLQFASIVEDCIKNGYKYYWHLADLECVDQNPGQSVQTKYVDVLPTVEKSYATLVKWIQDRATANNAPQPKVVFTNYANPFPPNGAECNDTNWLYPEQLKYLSSLVDQINGIIMQTITGLNDPNVAVADISGAYVVTGHVAHLVHGRSVGVRTVDLLGVESELVLEPGPVPSDAGRAGEHRRARHSRRPPVVCPAEPAGDAAAVDPADHGSRPDDLAARGRADDR